MPGTLSTVSPSCGETQRRALDVVDAQRARRAGAAAARRAAARVRGARGGGGGGEIGPVLVGVGCCRALRRGRAARPGGVGVALVDDGGAVADEIDDVRIGGAVRGGLAGERGGVVHERDGAAAAGQVDRAGGLRGWQRGAVAAGRLADQVVPAGRDGAGQRRGLPARRGARGRGQVLHRPAVDRTSGPSRVRPARRSPGRAWRRCCRPRRRPRSGRRRTRRPARRWYRARGRGRRPAGRSRRQRRRDARDDGTRADLRGERPGPDKPGRNGCPGP